MLSNDSSAAAAPAGEKGASVPTFVGEGPVHRSAIHPSELVAFWDPAIRTLADSWSQSAKTHANRPCTGTREFLAGGKRGEYKWKTYKEMNERVVNFGSALRGLGQSDFARIGIYSLNNEEWVIAEQACYQHSLIVVSVYDTLGPDSVEYVLNHADIKVMVCEARKVDNVLRCKAKCPALSHIVVIGAVDDKMRAAGQAAGVNIVSFTDAETQGRNNPVAAQPPQPNDLCTIMYTSGTTGDPKGVMLSHGNIISACAGVIHQGVLIHATDSYLSYLPLAHIFERVVLAFLWSRGARVGFYQGEAIKIIEDAQAIQPSLFCGAPRVFSRVYDRVMAGVKVASSIKRFLFNTAYKAKLSALAEGKDTPIWNKLVFHKLRNSILGPNVRIVISGSAPLSQEHHNFLRCVLCCDILQGYGLTETSAATCIALPGDRATLHVGPPTVCCEIKLLDVPEMNYTSATVPPKGEVCIRGHSVFQGYYRNEDETRKVLGADGWFRTGDVGQWNADGTLSIVDRVKNIFKLSQGEYIAAEKLEIIFVQSPYVAQAFVYGNSLHSVILCVCTLDLDQVGAWAKENLGVAPAPQDPAYAKMLCEHAKVKELVLADIARLCKENKLAGFEVPKGIHLEPELWSVDNGFMTPTFKLKRPQMTQKYRPICEAIYATMGSS